MIVWIVLGGFLIHFLWKKVNKKDDLILLIYWSLLFIIAPITFLVLLIWGGIIGKIIAVLMFLAWIFISAVSSDD